MCTGLSACFVPKSNVNCRLHQNVLEFLQKQQGFPKIYHEYDAPHFACSVVQRPHFACLYCKEKRKPCPLFPSAMASDHVCDSNSLGVGFLRGGTKMYFHVQSDLCLRAAPVWREQSADSSVVRISVHKSTDMQ